MANSEDWLTLIEELDQLIRAGKTQDAQQIIQKNLSKAPSEVLPMLAPLARRAGSPILAVRILRPFVRQEGRKIRPATPTEICEYAAALIFLNVTKEAFNLLKAIPATSAPQKLLYEGMAFFNLWDYENALPKLRDYLAFRNLDSYQELVARVNLCAALCATDRFDEFSKESLHLEENLRKHNAILLLQNFFELQAQYALGKEDHALLEKSLEKAESLIHDPNSIYAYYVRKWRGIGLIQSEKSRTIDLVKHLSTLRMEALKRRYWEVARDCDYQLALLKKDEYLMAKVYFGTPYESYKQKLRNEGYSPPDSWVWSPRPSKNPKSPNAQEAPDILEIGNLGLTSKVENLFRFLVSDLYKPTSAGALFDFLYDDEYFDPSSSPHRVNQVLYRFRKYLEQRSLPIAVMVKNHEYQIRSHSPIRLYADKILGDSDYLKLQSLFSKKLMVRNSDLVNELKISRRSATRLLNWAITMGLIVRSGEGAQSYYSSASFETASK